jgi:rhodanese-related sulfurtransferase
VADSTWTLLSPPPLAAGAAVAADETTAERWWEVRPPLDELRAEITPRISLHDMLSESQRDGGAVVFDVRPKEQFQAVRFPGSFHFNLLKLDDAAVANLERSRGRPLVVVSGRGDDGYRFAGKLVQMGFPYVSVLHGGIRHSVGRLRSAAGTCEAMKINHDCSHARTDYYNLHRFISRNATLAIFKV